MFAGAENLCAAVGLHPVVDLVAVAVAHFLVPWRLSCRCRRCRRLIIGRLVPHHSIVEDKLVVVESCRASKVEFNSTGSGSVYGGNIKSCGIGIGKSDSL